jgi:hypothetical protein
LQLTRQGKVKRDGFFYPERVSSESVRLSLPRLPFFPDEPPLSSRFDVPGILSSAKEHHDRDAAKWGRPYWAW